MSLKSISLFGALITTLACTTMAQVALEPGIDGTNASGGSMIQTPILVPTNTAVQATNLVAAVEAPDAELWALTLLIINESPADEGPLAQIRREIVADKSMSPNARNIAITAENGRVVLRGAVDSETEKRLIGAIAGGIAQAGNVDNELEVIFATASK